MIYKEFNKLYLLYYNHYQILLHEKYHKLLKMLNLIHSSILFCVFFLTYVSTFQVTFRKNVTLEKDTYFYLNHSFAKDLPITEVDYVDSVQTSYQIALVRAVFYIYL